MNKTPPQYMGAQNKALLKQKQLSALRLLSFFLKKKKNRNINRDTQKKELASL